MKAKQSFAFVLIFGFFFSFSLEVKAIEGTGAEEVSNPVVLDRVVSMMNRKVVEVPGPFDGPKIINTVTVSCTGLRLNARVALSAAHCADGIVPGSKVFSGSNKLIGTVDRAVRFSGATNGINWQRYFTDGQLRVDVALFVLKLNDPHTPLLGQVKIKDVQAQEILLTGYGRDLSIKSLRMKALSIGESLALWKKFESFWEKVNLDLLSELTKKREAVNEFYFTSIPSQEFADTKATLGDSGGPAYILDASGQAIILLGLLAKISTHECAAVNCQAIFEHSFVRAKAVESWILNELSSLGFSSPFSD